MYHLPNWQDGLMILLTVTPEYDVASHHTGKEPSIPITTRTSAVGVGGYEYTNVEHSSSFTLEYSDHRSRSGDGKTSTYSSKSKAT